MLGVDQVDEVEQGIEREEKSIFSLTLSSSDRLFLVLYQLIMQHSVKNE